MDRKILGKPVRKPVKNVSLSAIERLPNPKKEAPNLKPVKNINKKKVNTPNNNPNKVNKVGKEIILKGNGQHRAVGVVKGVLGIKEIDSDNGKIPYYYLTTEDNTYIKVSPIYGFRVFIENPENHEKINKPINYIAYPNINKKGDVRSLVLVAFDENFEDRNYFLKNGEFFFKGVWYKNKINVQESIGRFKKLKNYNKDEKNKRKRTPKIYKIQFENSGDFELKEHSLYEIKALFKIEFINGKPFLKFYIKELKLA